MSKFSNSKKLIIVLITLIFMFGVYVVYQYSKGANKVNYTNKADITSLPEQTAAVVNQTATHTPVSKKAEVITQKPVVTEETLENPYTGFAQRANLKGFEYPFSLVFSYVTWKDLEPEKGKIDFQKFEAYANFDFWKAKGKKIIIRFVLDYPQKESHRDIPDWLYHEISGDGTDYATSYGKGFSPNYSNPILIQNHAATIAKLAERYNKNPFVAFIELGSIGQWGEWHISRDMPGAGMDFPKENIANQYVQPYVDGFKNKFLLLRRPMPIASKNGMGLFHDAYGDSRQTRDWFISFFNNGYTWWQTNEKFPAMPGFWKNSPCGGEPSSPFTTVLNNSKIDSTIAEVKDTHASYWRSMGIDYSTANPLLPNIKRLLNTMGYRFILSSISYENRVVKGAEVNINMVWENKGVAPFYYKWPVQISLSNEKGVTVLKKLLDKEDIRKWLPGKKNIGYKLSIPKTMESGEYKINVAIIDPETGLPGIKLAIKGLKDNGEYEIGVIAVDD